MKNSSRLLSVLIFAIFMTSSIAISGVLHAGTGSSDSPSGRAAKPFSTQYYPVRLVEHGLPQYTEWYIYVSKNGNSVSSKPANTNRQTITFYEAPGNYSFYVSTNSGYVTQRANIMATVVHSLVVINLTFVREFNVTIHERGLPTSAVWDFSIGANNTNLRGTGDYIAGNNSSYSVYLFNGSYTLSATDVVNPGLSFNGGKMPFRVEGSKLSLTVDFYRVDLTENGIYPFHGWGLRDIYSVQTSNGTLHTVSRLYPGKVHSMILYLPNGSYDLHPVSEGYYYHGGRNITVSGSDMNSVIHFQKGYNVTFVEHGLPTSPAVAWSVSGFPTAYGSNTFHQVNGLSVSYLVPNGTYLYNIPREQLTKNYNGVLYQLTVAPEKTNYAFTVNGSNTTVNIYYKVTAKEIRGRFSYNADQPLFFISVIVFAFGLTFAANMYSFRKRRNR